MRSVTHVDEGARAIKGERSEPLLGQSFFGVGALVGLSHRVEPRERFGERQLFALEHLRGRDDPAHALFELGKIGVGDWAAQKKIVIEAIFDGRTEPQLGVGSQLQDGLREHVRQAVSDLVKR